MKLDPATADTLLDRLSSDDAFRDLFQRSPREALASIGHGDAANKSLAEGSWTCLAVSQLASKETIRATRDELRRQLVSAQAGQSPINLEMKRAQ